IDIDLAAHFCREYGYRLEIVQMDFPAILPAVLTGKCEFACGGIAYTAERAETFYYSEFTMESYSVMAVLKGTGISGQKNIVSSIRESFEKTFIRENRWKLFVSGAGVTTLITICSIVIGTILGFAVYMACRHGNVFANKTTNFFMWLIHGMPTVLFLMILYYVIFGSSRLPGMWISVVGFSLIFACSMIDMLRVGYNAIGRGQYEASTAMGYSDSQSFFRILLPQAAHHFLPIYSNEVVTLIKETSVVGYIAVLDLTKISDLVRSRTYEAFFALILTAVVYFVIQEIMIRIVKAIQKKIDPRRRSNKKILEGIDIKDWDLF
ncbi:MAG: ABC transporter substrate-binding protein/permease, partial [Spirochaetales bacterium]|nr:ABC transporter substrate-binding protein/permease [Spirochaetales bacterium]